MQALLVVDVQNDFCPGGALAVPDGDAIIPEINALMTEFSVVVLTQDWHPVGHVSFASSHLNKKAFDTMVIDGLNQTLWPNHCVQGSEGANFHAHLNTDSAQYIIRKGYRPLIDSYSGFFENDGTTPTGLFGLAKSIGITHWVVVGLATDFCVKWTALDARRLGFDVTVIESAVKGIDIDGSVEAAWIEMEAAGIVRSKPKYFANVSAATPL